jgi:hypothetical protein
MERPPGKDCIVNMMGCGMARKIGETGHAALPRLQQALEAKTSEIASRRKIGDWSP